LSELHKAAFSPNVPEEVRDDINKSMKHLFPELLSAREVVDRLTDLKKGNHQNWDEYELAALHRRAQSLCDERMVPLFVDLLDQQLDRPAKGATS
jgi:hypothetical protein